MLKVNILLSAYNGEKYIAAQIQSIQQQTFTDWNLVIRDDGSKDKTCQIVEEFVKSDERIQLLKAENVGVIDSFYQLVKSDRADFYFFCDQDDFWLPEKVQLMIDFAQKQNNSKPALYYTDLKVVDKNLNIMNESMIKSQSDHANTTLVQELTENSVTGCTMMINDELAKLWTDTNDIIMHDWYLALLAAAYGKIHFINQPTVLYRQHDNNVLGARTWSKRIQKWLHPNLWFEKYWWLIIASQKQAAKLSNLTKDDENLVNDFVHIMEKSRAERRQILNKYNLRKNKNYHTLVFRNLILTKFAYKGNKK